MAGYDGLIQPIVVRKSGTHEQMVEAAARASVAAWLTDPTNPAWEPWLAASFGKTVRRGRNVEIEKCREFFVASAQVGDAEAFACLPYLKAEVPAPIRKLQVSGTDRDRGEWTQKEDRPIGPYLAVNLGANMSTGKTCAQVAHGVFAWALKQTPEHLTAWQEAGLPFFVTDCSQELFTYQRTHGSSRLIVIEDAGHTEVAPGTATVLAWL
jgi:peptidyl-tRNA hydrolase